jgi:transmembrane sensor
MSGQGIGNTARPISADDVRAQAAEWLARRVSGEWTEAEQKELDAWMQRSASHRVAFLRVQGAWSHTYRLAALRKPMLQKVPPSKARSFVMARAAAILAVVAVGIGTTLYLQKPQERIFATALGDRATVTLGDGSVVELNTDTKLRARIGADKRTLWLDKGEAYFKVVHDPKRPFVVIAGNRRLTDIGTKFIVRRDADRLKVSLLEGSVQFDTNGSPGKAPILLVSGDELVATNTSVSTTRRPLTALSKEMSWRTGMLVFDKASLADIATEFNRYNRKKLVIADATAARRTIGASFSINDVELFARMARNVLRLHVEDRGDKIVISR